jgi:hypothetical protein
MSLSGPKASSVTQQGELDEFQVGLGWERQVGNAGDTRLIVSVPPDRLRMVHIALLKALEPPLALLYRRCVFRQAPKPNGSPPEDFLAHELTLQEILVALANAADLIWHDARCEVWVRGRMGEQIVLDQDGLLYAYPDDPVFREALDHVGVPEQHVEVLLDRDYVKHHYHASCDELEERLIRDLYMVPVAPQEQH